MCGAISTPGRQHAAMVRPNEVAYLVGCHRLLIVRLTRSASLALSCREIEVRGPTIPGECRGLVDRVAELARTRFAPRAAQVDRDAAFPIENYRDLHAAGLLGLTVPQEVGGVGADPPTDAPGRQG